MYHPRQTLEATPWEGITLRFWIAAVFLCAVAALAFWDAGSKAEAETLQCVPHSSEEIDGWVSQGIALAGLPDDPGRHGALKGQAWVESRFIPIVVNTYDANALEGHPSVGLEQVEPITWGSTAVGKNYPFGACATDPVVSVAVRAQLFEIGWFG